MAAQKTRPTGADVATFFGKLTQVQRREEAAELLIICQSTTGFKPAIWGKDLIGFGDYEYRYRSGHSGQWFASGFAVGKAAISIYILPGYQGYADLFGKLGPHKSGKSCIVIKSLRQTDQSVLLELIRTGLRNLGRLWSIHPS